MTDVKSYTRASQSDNEFLNYCLATSLDPSLHRPCIQPIITVRKSDSLHSIFKRLSNIGVLSAPVIGDFNDQFEGFVTLFDIVNFITSLHWGASGEEWDNFMNNHREWRNTEVRDIMDTPLWRGRQASTPLYRSNTTFHALEKLAITGSHRAVVLQSAWSSSIVNIITQSMLVSEIRQRMHMLGSLRKKRVEDMVDMFQVVRTVNENSTAMNAFITMRDSNVHGLAMVDDDGVLTGAISVRDLRGIGVDGPSFARLFASVKEFKATCRREFPSLGPRAHYYIGQTPVKGRYITPNSTFEDIINRMADGCIHRVFVCSQESVDRGLPEPENVISQTDVLKLVLKHFAMPASNWEVAGRG